MNTRARSQPRMYPQPSPVDRGQDINQMLEIDERSGRSRSLDPRSRPPGEEYPVSHTENFAYMTVPKQTYYYQPYMETKMPEDYRDYGNMARYKEYSPRMVDERDWGNLDRSIRKYRNETLIPITHHGNSYRSSAQVGRKEISGKNSGAVVPVTNRQQTTVRSSSNVRSERRPEYHYRRHSLEYLGNGSGPRVEERGMEEVKFERQARSKEKKRRCFDRTSSAGTVYYRNEMSQAGGYPDERSIYGKHHHEQRYYKIHCCCFSFRWPPWSYEEIDPPKRIYKHN